MGLISRCEILNTTSPTGVGDLTTDVVGWCSASTTVLAVHGSEYSYGQGGKGLPRYLLSDHICIMARLDFKAAVVGPEIHGYADASDTALVYLDNFSAHISSMT